jgi:hypothetical protein
MRSILAALSKIFLVYCVSAVVAEVAIAHFIAFQINALTHASPDYLATTLSALCALGTKLTSFNWG